MASPRNLSRNSRPRRVKASAQALAETELTSQRELLQAVFECASYGIYYATAEGTILLCNDALLRLSGLDRSQLVGQAYHTVTAPEDIPSESQAVGNVLLSGLPTEYTKTLVRKNGFRIPVHCSVAPFRDQDGNIVGTVTIVRDVVAEQESAKALRESEEKYRAAFCNNPDAIFVVGENRLIVDANPAATRLTGVCHESLMRCPLDCIVPDNRPDNEKTFSSVDSATPRLRHSRLAASGNAAVEAEVHEIALGSGLWQVLARDVTARLQAETKLIALKDLLEEMVIARTRELEKANAALAHAGRMKDEFLANMSHELRTPLNSVLGLADALLEGIYGPLDEQQSQILMTMRDAGRHLLELINDILDLSKIEAGRLELDYRCISVSEVCQASLRMIRPLAIAKRIGTWMRTDPKFNVVVADERRLKQMLVNLLSNAVKFTPNGGSAGVEAWSLAQEVFFSVTDTGIGISPPDQRRIFEPFTQIDSSLSRRHEGTGLGLALVRRLAELHGGRIEVESEPGRGSRFTVILPRILPTEPSTVPPQENA